MTDASDVKSRTLTLDEALPLIASPDSGAPLERAPDGSIRSADGGECFPMRGEVPLLFPACFLPYLGGTCLEMPLNRFGDAKLQYGLLASIKYREGFPNSPYDSAQYRGHVEHVRRLVQGARGTVLDIGCDNPSISSGMFPAGTRYLGLDPLLASTESFRLAGMAEYLPIRDQAFDNVALISALDHILDHHRALDEAWRVLKPGGAFFFQSLAWESGADLHYDHLHFHHFREFELLGALARFDLVDLRREQWKGDRHRFSLYVHARRKD